MIEDEDQMEHEDENEGSGMATFIAGVAVGAVLGATVALLMAPESGEKTRRRVGKQVRAVRKDAAGHLEELRERGGRELRDRGSVARKRFGRAAREAMEAL
ncbi:MAG: YtxH domain-containing protein, partial [Gemmatimonadales bacterium]